jgi:polyhydroxyalkanoate synthesis repressor PhaR
VADPVRLIKRYANRKLYDTGSGELTSLRRIEELVRAGVDIRVVDHDTGDDMTSEVLVGILGNAMGSGTIDGDTTLLTSLIRAPDDLLAAMFKDDQRTEELRAMGERVRLLSATIDALLGQMDGDGEPVATPPRKPAARKRTGPARKARS